ncbi:MAG: S9 family peptidase [candidate division Zixibacteria bacterium]|nr:S9 family peptidase [candidate division Zixibacteria bacterium]
MNTNQFLFIGAIIFLAVFSVFITCAKESATNNTPPIAKIEPKVDTTHGDIRVDNYFWLRNRDDSSVLSYLQSENEYTDAVMASTEDLQVKLYDEMVSRIKETDLSVPVKDDDYFYYHRTEEGKQYKIYCRKKGSLKAEEEILLNLNAMAEGKEFFDLGIFEVSPNHQMLAYSIDTTGNEQYVLFFKNLATGKVLPEAIPNTSDLAWANDNHTVFYSVEDSTHRPYKVSRHEVGTNPDLDVLVYREENPSFWIGVGKTKSEKYILIQCGSKVTSEVRFLDADKPTGKLRLVHPRQHGMEYSLSHHGDFFYIVTNDKALNFKLVKTPVMKPNKKNWIDVILPSDTMKIDRAESFDKFLVVHGRINGLRQIMIRDFKTDESYIIDQPEPVFTVYGGANPDFSSETLRFVYQSMVTPRSVYDFNMVTHKRILMKRTEVLAGYDPENYRSERIFATADDGTQIPVSLVYRKGMEQNSNNPLLLYGYGSYGMSMDPWFSSRRLSLLDRGFIYAIAHIRGGGEMGRQWYEDGKLLNKKNTFTDFIACGDYLVEEKYTSHDLMVISGGSAGGLLIGAVLNMRPDMAAVAIADVPFVDVINTMLDPTIPLTVIEYDEWGNPNDEKFYHYMKSYSPYDNVTAQNYPNILVEAGLNDARVQYWEPAKWVAKLRATKADSNLLLLKTNMGAGHGGSSGRYDYLKEIAFDYAFALKCLEIKD